MKVERFTSATEFLRVAGAFLAVDEVENNLILGIARVVSAREPVSGPSPFFAVVRDADRIVMCAFQTIPGRIGITRALAPGAVDALVDDVCANGPEVVFVGGVEPTAGETANRFATRTNRHARLHSGQRIHRLDRVTPLQRRASGTLRRAHEGDRRTVEMWVIQFFVDVGEHGDVRSLAAARLRDDPIYVWDAGGIVSMASTVTTSETGVRIALVYTPPELRGRGYASACVEALSQRMLDEGRRYCCLYTDLANPTSNAIYRRIGYVPVCDAGAYTLEEL